MILVRLEGTLDLTQGVAFGVPCDRETDRFQTFLCGLSVTLFESGAWLINLNPFLSKLALLEKSLAGKGFKSVL